MGYDRFPPSFRDDIAEVVQILRDLGAEHVYLFGSVLSVGDGAHDIDIAVSGLPQSEFFRAYGRLSMALSHPFDLVDLDNDAAFVRTLRESGQLEEVA
jgi:predicted nucleotidyltransferase